MVSLHNSIGVILSSLIFFKCSSDAGFISLPPMPAMRVLSCALWDKASIACCEVVAILMFAWACCDCFLCVAGLCLSAEEIFNILVDIKFHGLVLPFWFDIALCPVMLDCVVCYIHLHDCFFACSGVEQFLCAENGFTHFIQHFFWYEFVFHDFASVIIPAIARYDLNMFLWNSSSICAFLTARSMLGCAC